MASEEKTGWEYNPSGATATAEPPKPAPTTGKGAKQPPGGGSIKWTASEYIQHDRNAGWYVTLAAMTILLSAIIYLISRDLISIVIVLALGLVVGLFARRRPVQLDYEITESGIQIGPKFYNYGTFKAFSIDREGAVPSVNLEPMKRFMPPISIYFAGQDEEQIMSALSNRLPYQEHQPDAVEKLAQRLKL